MTTKPDDIDLKFKSSNGVPVDSARISVEEWESIKSTLTDAKTENDSLRARVAELERLNSDMCQLNNIYRGHNKCEAHKDVIAPGCAICLMNERDQLRQQVADSRNAANAKLERYRRWIAYHPAKDDQDHACRECVPHSDMLVDGYLCPYHEALKDK